MIIRWKYFISPFYGEELLVRAIVLHVVNININYIVFQLGRKRVYSGRSGPGGQGGLGGLSGQDRELLYPEFEIIWILIIVMFLCFLFDMLPGCSAFLTALFFFIQVLIYATQFETSKL